MTRELKNGDFVAYFGSEESLHGKIGRIEKHAGSIRPDLWSVYLGGLEPRLVGSRLLRLVPYANSPVMKAVRGYK